MKTLSLHCMCQLTEFFEERFWVSPLLMTLNVGTAFVLTTNHRLDQNVNFISRDNEQNSSSKSDDNGRNKKKAKIGQKSNKREERNENRNVLNGYSTWLLNRRIIIPLDVKSRFWRSSISDQVKDFN
ncbi:CLUMA_CG020726, isoform A [Clunio marinus]|uniref:CLUMA_CG020726, isoform A n=1 Tax=Clunio marinus TaxID=568069 RepID=A0A1J1J7M0_9DIPT|nr:CLUMA_CG020726, isoform A [Clunio marinus]